METYKKRTILRLALNLLQAASTQLTLFLPLLPLMTLPQLGAANIANNISCFRKVWKRKIACI